MIERSYNGYQENSWMPGMLFHDRVRECVHVMKTYNL